MRACLPSCCAGLLSATVAALPAHADSVTDFYKGRTVTLIAGYSSGGGFDRYARVVANHIGRHIPGQPHIVVQNMPGAGSTRAANYVFNVAPKDGSVISLIRAPVIEPLVGDKGAAFVSTQYTWLGSGASDLTVCALLGNPKVRTMADAVRHEFTLGGLGPGSDEDMYAKILKKLFGLKIKLVTGYPGGAELILAVERGEIDGRCGWAFSSIKISKPDWIAQKKLKIINVLALERSPELPTTPAVMEFATNDRQKQILKFVLNAQTLGRPFAAPPNIPADRAAALRKAFDETMVDPALLAEMTAQKLEVNHIRWQAMERLLRGLYSTPKAIVAETRAIIAE